MVVVVACSCAKSTDDCAAFARLPGWAAAAHKFEVGRATGQCCLGVLCMSCWRVGSMQKKGKARQGKTNPPAHAEQSWQGGKKMGKGGQENEALTTPCAHGLGCFRLLL